MQNRSNENCTQERKGDCLMRKNWKKALTLVMAAAMAAGLAGCGNGAKQTEETTAAQTEAAKTEASNGG